MRRQSGRSPDSQTSLNGEFVMARFTLALFVACAIGTGFATAFDEASDRNDPLKDATREELRIKIKQLELEIAHLKFEQKKLAAQQKVLPKWWNLTTTRGDQASPVPPQLPPGLLDLPEYSGPWHQRISIPSAAQQLSKSDLGHAERDDSSAVQRHDDLQRSVRIPHGQRSARVCRLTGGCPSTCPRRATEC
jgi:hypothetical protein